MISRAEIYQQWCLIIDALKSQLYHSEQFPFPFCYTLKSKAQDIESVISVNNNAEQHTDALYESSIILTSINSSLIAAVLENTEFHEKNIHRNQIIYL